MTIEKHDGTGHRKRLKDKLKENSSFLADYEILELLLGLVLTRKDTKPLAKSLLHHFDTFRGVLDAPLSELEKIDGFGDALKTFWILLHECKARYVESRARRRQHLLTLKDVGEMAIQRLAGLSHEEVWAALVDTQNRLICWKCLSKGSLDQIAILPRDILSVAYEMKASGFFLTHNHPGGALRPSSSDISLTRALIKGAHLLGIRFIDHLIVADNEVVSMRGKGFFEESSEISQ